MLKEALAFLAGQTANALTPQIIDSKDPENLHFAIGGAVQVLPKKPTPRAHEVRTIEALTDFIAAGDAGWRVWHHDEAVELICDDETRRDKVTMPLEHTDVWKTVASLGDWMEQARFVRLLRVELHSALPPSVLLEKVRKLRSENSASASGDVQHASRGFGREIGAKVSGESEIPEEVILSVPVYGNPGERQAVAVRCAVEIDAARFMLRLVPMPDELTLALEIVQRDIGKRLSESLPGHDGRILYGRP